MDCKIAKRASPVESAAGRLVRKERGGEREGKGRRGGKREGKNRS